MNPSSPDLSKLTPAQLKAWNKLQSAQSEYFAAFNGMKPMKLQKELSAKANEAYSEYLNA